MTKPNPILDALSKAMQELGIPAKVETSAQQSSCSPPTTVAQ